jgi:prepilin-type N-terminal cleavage/methylation domain-containing protein
MPMSAEVTSLRHLLARARQEHGFGMVELLAAMTVMLVGIMAVYGLFQAGLLQIRRASTITTAAALADTEMEKFRAIKYESLGLSATAVAAAASDPTYGPTYTGDGAYRADTAPATTLSLAPTPAQTTITVASFTGFPSEVPYLVKVENELMIVNEGAGTNTWTVARGALGTTAATHPAGASVTQKQRVDVAACGTQPCTDMVPTKTLTGADGKAYRVDTYVTWKMVTSSSTPATSGRLFKLITLVVRDTAPPYKQWARMSSAFDESTGL